MAPGISRQNKPERYEGFSRVVKFFRLEAVDHKIISIADRFGFTLPDIESLTMVKMNYWYKAAEKLYERERNIGGKGGE